MQKIAIVYYSLTGNTDYVAHYISKYIDADLIRINPVKEYPDKGFKKYYWCGKSAVMKDMPELEEYSFNANKYDYIIFGTPVWASTFISPIRSFINKNRENIKNKKIGVFISYSGGGADKTLNKLKEYLDIKEFNNTLVLIDPSDKNNKEKDDKIKDFCKKI